MDRFLPSNHLSPEIGLGTRVRMLTVSAVAAVRRVADELKAQTARWITLFIQSVQSRSYGEYFNDCKLSRVTFRHAPISLSATEDRLSSNIFRLLNSPFN